MDLSQLRPAALTIAAIIAGVVIFFFEYLFMPANSATILLTLTFWTAIIQGTVAVAAAADASKGKWADPLKKELLSSYPLILFAAFLSLAIGIKIEVFPWNHSNSAWLTKSFFLSRNFILLLTSFIIARFYAKASLTNSKRKETWAVLYLFVFVVNQTIIAFDWVMSLEYPWFSTLFGGIFFMEAFYLGLVYTGLASAYILKKGTNHSPEMKKVLRDSATFMFGFALAWAGLFYAQYLVIWYGNLPEETSFWVIRMQHSPYKEMFYAHFFLIFIIPFIAFLSRKIKVSTRWVPVISIMVLTGIFLERIMFILPAASINFAGVVLEFILIGFLLVLFFSNRTGLFEKLA